MKKLISNSGQFIPISAMIMFTIVVLMIAMVNVYKVSRAKLKVQNLADAAALNLASKEAQAFNAVADRNEWMNHMVGGVPSPSDDPTNPQGNMTTCPPDNPSIVPGISCVENDYLGNSNSAAMQAGHVFHSQSGAQNYANLVQTINAAQRLFVQAYNSFLGATGIGSGPNSANFVSLLQNDIPDLQDPSIHLAAWNSSANEASSISQAQNMANGTSSSSGNLVPNMQPLQFQVAHDVKTRYFFKRCALGYCVQDAGNDPSTFGELVYGKNGVAGPDQYIGWMVPNQSGPQISVTRGSGSTASRTGVGVYVSKKLDLPVVGSYLVTAESKAYVVQDSGINGETPTGGGGYQPAQGGRSDPPLFRPSYWVRLAND